jgi:histidinol-phosphatase
MYQNPALEVITKPDGSPVTPADKQGETIIRAAIERAFPDDAILGEEFPSKAGRSGYRWVIDPIDGTRAFTRGQPTWGVLIGVEHTAPSGARSIVAGYAGFPALGEALWASSGGGAWWRTGTQGVREARVSGTSALEHAIVDTLWPRTYANSGKHELWSTLTSRVQRLRTWSDALSFAMVATGRVDAAVDFGCSLWDIAPFAIIVPEAGGRFSDWQRGDGLDSKTHLASNGHLHEPLLGVL